MMEERLPPPRGGGSVITMGPRRRRRRRDPANARGGGAAATVGAAASLSLVLALSSAATWKGGGGVGVATVAALNLRGDDGGAIDVDIDVDVAANHRDGPAASSAAHRRRRPRSSVRRRHLGGENADEMTNWSLAPLYEAADGDAATTTTNSDEEGPLPMLMPGIIATLPVPYDADVDAEEKPPVRTFPPEVRSDDLLEMPPMVTVPPPTLHLDPMSEFKPLMWWPTQLDDGVKLCVHSNEYPDGFTLIFPTEIECCSTYDICPIPDGKEGKEIKWYPHAEAAYGAQSCVEGTDYPDAFLQFGGLLFDTRDDCCDSWPDACIVTTATTTTTTTTVREVKWYPSTSYDGRRICAHDADYPDGYLLLSSPLMMLFDAHEDCCDAFPEACLGMLWYPNDGRDECELGSDFPEARDGEDPMELVFLTRGECCARWCNNDGPEGGGEDDDGGDGGDGNGTVSPPTDGGGDTTTVSSPSGGENDGETAATATATAATTTTVITITTTTTTTEDTTVAPQSGGNDTTVAPQSGEDDTTIAPQPGGDDTTIAPQSGGDDTTIAPQSGEDDTTIAPQPGGDDTTSAAPPDEDGSTVVPTQVEGTSKKDATRSAYWYPSTGSDGARLCIWDTAYPESYLDSASPFLFDDETACCEAYGICEQPPEATPAAQSVYWYPFEDAYGVKLCLHDNNYPAHYLGSATTMLFDDEGACCAAYGICAPVAPTTIPNKPMAWWPADPDPAEEGGGEPRCVYGNEYPDAYYRESSVTLFSTEHECCSAYDVCPEMWYPYRDPETGSSSCEHGSDYPADYLHEEFRVGTLFESMEGCCLSFPIACVHMFWYPAEGADGTMECAYGEDYPEEYGEDDEYLFLEEETCCARWCGSVTESTAAAETTPATTAAATTTAAAFDPCDDCVWHESIVRYTTCTNSPDDYPDWWDSPGARPHFFFRTAEDCCDTRYPDGCHIHDANAPVVAGPEDGPDGEPDDNDGGDPEDSEFTPMGPETVDDFEGEELTVPFDLGLPPQWRIQDGPEVNATVNSTAHSGSRSLTNIPAEGPGASSDLVLKISTPFVASVFCMVKLDTSQPYDYFSLHVNGNQRNVYHQKSSDWMEVRTGVGAGENEIVFRVQNTDLDRLMLPPERFPDTFGSGRVWIDDCQVVQF